MKLSHLTLAFLSLVASVSYAKAPLPVLRLGKNLVAHGHVQKPKRPNAPQCANFTGTWQGTCVDQDGQSYSDTLVLDQDNCDTLTIGGFDANIGGTVSVNSQPNPNAEDPFSYSGTLSYGWNDSQSKLYSLTSISILDGSYASVSRSSMWLAGAQLRVKDDAGSTLSLDGTEGLSMNIQDCTYDRAGGSR